MRNPILHEQWTGEQFIAADTYGVKYPNKIYRSCRNFRRWNILEILSKWVTFVFVFEHTRTQSKVFRFFPVLGGHGYLPWLCQISRKFISPYSEVFFKPNHTQCRFSLTGMDIHQLKKSRFFCFCFCFFFFHLPCYSFSYSPLLSRSLPSVIPSSMQLCYQGLKGIDPIPSLHSTSDWRTKWRPKCYLELLSKGIQ